MNRDLCEAWSGPDSVPGRSLWMSGYPLRAVLLHAKTRAFSRKVDDARRMIDALPLDATWSLSLSGGKDSTALALLVGARVRWSSVKDDLDYPGEDLYLRKLADKAGADLTILRPAVSLRDWLRETRTSLESDLHASASPLSARWFHALLKEDRERSRTSAVLLGLRAEESLGRTANLAHRGDHYVRGDGVTIATPIARWSTIDVHAFVLSQGVPLLPVYGCVDDSMPWDRIRKSWFLAGGGLARHGHYAWLRDWWPDLYMVARDIDAAVSRLS